MWKSSWVLSRTGVITWPSTNPNNAQSLKFTLTFPLFDPPKVGNWMTPGRTNHWIPLATHPPAWKISKSVMARTVWLETSWVTRPMCFETLLHLICGTVGRNKRLNHARRLQFVYNHAKHILKTCTPTTFIFTTELRLKIYHMTNTSALL